MLRPFLSEVREWLFPPEHNSAPRVDGKGGAKGGAANHLDEKRREVCAAGRDRRLGAAREQHGL